MVASALMTMREQFEREGILVPLRALDGDALQRVRGEYARLVQAHDGSLKHFDRSHLYFRWAYELCLHPPIVDAVASVIGDDVIVWGSLILSKPAHDPGFVAWHQDGFYADFLGQAPAVSAWIALSDSTTESGCMRVVPGSHTRRYDHEEIHRPQNMLNRGQEIAVEVDERDAVDVVLRAGEMSLHHVDIIHGSNANQSTWARTGFIVRYSTPAMLRSVTPVVRARGRDVAHLDVLREPPPGDFDEALSRYRAARPMSS
jgi:ectoine hydroxylase-related dioxygenase (phytanoyl-CoA dioxygenase family)